MVMKNKSLERVKKRLVRNAPMTMISMRLPEQMIEELREIAAAKGFSGYQGLIRFYISKGMRSDIEELDRPKIEAIARSLAQSGVAESVIEKALESA